MSSSMFERLGGQAPQRQQKSPRSVVLERLKDMGIEVPQGMENNPQKLLQHLLQSGTISQDKVNAAQQMAQRLFSQRGYR